MAGVEAARYAHSLVHHAVATRDHDALRRVLGTLPRARKPEEIRSEVDSVAEEARADAVSAVIDRRNVPGRETPLHLAVRRGGRDAHGGGGRLEPAERAGLERAPGGHLRARGGVGPGEKSIELVVSDGSSIETNNVIDGDTGSTSNA